MKQHIKIINIFLTLCIILLLYKAVLLFSGTSNNDAITKNDSSPLQKNSIKNASEKTTPIFGSHHQTASPSEFPYKLTGTLISDEIKSIAILEDLHSGKQHLYSIGDTIATHKLIQIKKDTILLKNKSGQQKQLFLNTKKQNLKSAEKNNVKQISSNSWQIKENLLNHSLTDINSFLKQVRIVPHFKNGNANGFRFNNITKESFLRKIGFKDGDILKSIDGVIVNNPYSAIKALKSILINEKKNVTLSIERGNQTLTLTYKIV